MLNFDRAAGQVRNVPPPRRGRTPRGPVVLVEARFASQLLFADTPSTDLHDIAYPALTASLLETIAPVSVVTPLVGNGFDVLDVAARLAEAGFTGTLYTLAPNLPKPRMIAAEVGRIAPGLDVAMIEVIE